MERILRINAEVALVFGLRWQVLDALESKARVISDLRTDGARWKATFDNAGDQNFGTLSDADFSLPQNVKRSLSGAGQVALLPQFSGKTVLVLLEDPGRDGNDGVVAAIGLLNGNVVLDAIAAVADIGALVQSFSERCDKAKQQYTLAGNTSSFGTLTQLVDWNDLLPKATSKFKTTPAVPVTPLRSAHAATLTVAGITLLLLGIGAYAGYEMYAKKKLEERAAKAAQMQDPVAMYSAALPSFLAQPRMLAADAFPAVRRLTAEMPVLFAGWELRRIDCTGEVCSVSWERAGGTNADFKTRAPQHWRDIAFSDDAKQIVHNVALAIPQKPLPPRTEWPRFADFKLSVGSQWQKFSDFGIKVGHDKLTVAALPPGVSPDAVANNPIAVKAAPWSVKAAPWWGNEGLSTMPPNVTVTSITINVTSREVTFDAAGDIYVQP